MLSPIRMRSKTDVCGIGFIPAHSRAFGVSTSLATSAISCLDATVPRPLRSFFLACRRSQNRDSSFYVFLSWEYRRRTHNPYVAVFASVAPWFSSCHHRAVRPFSDRWPLISRGVFSAFFCPFFPLPDSSSRSCFFFFADSFLIRTWLFAFYAFQFLTFFFV